MNTKVWNYVVLSPLIFLMSCNNWGKDSSINNNEIRAINSKIYFVRHAETEKNAGISFDQDVFSKPGEDQVVELTQNLEGFDFEFDNIFVSPTWRTQNTIKNFLENKGYGKPEDYLEERITECCWDESSDARLTVADAANHIKSVIEGSEASTNTLIVGHYHSGKELLKELVGEQVEPQNANIMEFDYSYSIEVEGSSKFVPTQCQKTNRSSLQFGDLPEISGVAFSSDKNTIYGHNDSGDGAKFVLFDLEGQKKGQVNVNSANAVDWEDMDVGPCLDSPNDSCVYIADIGNNSGKRGQLSIYIMPEPLPGMSSVDAKRIDFSYPGNRGYDAEAFVVSKKGEMFVIRKTGDNNNTLYRIPAESNSNVAEEICTFKDMGSEKVTAADINNSDKRLIVRTYEKIYEYEADSISSPDICAQKAREPIPHAEPQGEAIAYYGQTYDFITLSEKKSDTQSLYYFACTEQSGDGSVVPSDAAVLPSAPPLDGPDLSTRDNNAGSCQDIPPPGSSYTCREQAGFGKCGRSWMQGFCLESCGQCSASISGTCYDLPPPGSSYSCEQQQQWGKCGRYWMQGYCNKSCNRCGTIVR